VRGWETRDQADSGHHVEDFDGGAFGDFFPRGVERDAFERCESGHVRYEMPARSGPMRSLTCSGVKGLRR
jgi:hypothetical protein